MTLADYAPIPEEIPQALAGVVLQVLAVVALRVGFGSRLNRAFALYFTLSAHAIFWGGMDDTPALRSFALGVWPWFGLASPFALAYLALRFREHHEGVRVPRWAGWSLLAGAVAIEVVYALRHDLFNAGDTGSPVWGPLYPLSFSGVGFLLSPVLAYWFARRAHAAEPSMRPGLVLAATALVVGAAFEITYSFVREATFLLQGGSVAGWFELALLFRVPGAVFGVAAVVVARRAGYTYPLAVALAAAGTAVVAALARTTGVFPWLPNASAGVWTLTMAALLTHAVLRGQLVQLDARFRFAISRSTIAAAFVAAFFLASESAQLVLGRENAYLGLVGAGALVFALAPLQRAAERLAERAVPVQGAAPANALAEHPALDAYRYAVRAAIADGVMTPEEELHLAEVAHRLHIPQPDAVRARREVERELGRGT